MIPGWQAEIKQEYLRVVQTLGSGAPSAVAAQLGVSEPTAVFWLTELAREGSLRIVGVELNAAEDSALH